MAFKSWLLYFQARQRGVTQRMGLGLCVSTHRARVWGNASPCLIVLFTWLKLEIALSFNLIVGSGRSIYHQKALFQQISRVSKIIPIEVVLKEIQSTKVCYQSFRPETKIFHNFLGCGIGHFHIRMHFLAVRKDSPMHETFVCIFFASFGFSW